MGIAVQSTYQFQDIFYGVRTIVRRGDPESGGIDVPDPRGDPDFARFIAEWAKPAHLITLWSGPFAGRHHMIVETAQRDEGRERGAIFVTLRCLASDAPDAVDLRFEERFQPLGDKGERHRWLAFTAAIGVPAGADPKDTEGRQLFAEARPAVNHATGKPMMRHGLLAKGFEDRFHAIGDPRCRDWPRRQAFIDALKEDAQEAAR